MDVVVIVYQDALFNEGSIVSSQRRITSWQVASQLGLPLADDSYFLFV